MNSQDEQKTTETEMPKRPGRCRDRGRGRRFLWKAPLFLIAILAKGGVVFWLWNALIPDLFHGPEVTYLQALGLMVLAKLLVGFGGGPFGRFGRPHGGPRGFGRHRHHLGHKWKNMSHDERHKLREELRKRWHE